MIHPSLHVLPSLLGSLALHLSPPISLSLLRASPLPSLFPHQYTSTRTVIDAPPVAVIRAVFVKQLIVVHLWKEEGSMYKSILVKFNEQSWYTFHNSEGM